MKEHPVPVSAQTCVFSSKVILSPLDLESEIIKQMPGIQYAHPTILYVVRKVLMLIIILYLCKNWWQLKLTAKLSCCQLRSKDALMVTLLMMIMLTITMLIIIMVAMVTMMMTMLIMMMMTMVIRGLVDDGTVSLKRWPTTNTGGRSSMSSTGGSV